MAAGWRLALTRPVSARLYENQVYELLADPREYRVGCVTEGVIAFALPVGVCTRTARRYESRTPQELIDAIVAIWSSREAHQTTGAYEEFDGEAPLEFEADTGQPLVGAGDDERRYRITSSITDLEGPRVKFTARRCNG